MGGNFQSAPSIGGSGSFNYFKTISYNQKNYVTEVESQNSKGVKWGVKANSFVTPNGQVSAYDQSYLPKTQLVQRRETIFGPQIINYLL